MATKKKKRNLVDLNAAVNNFYDALDNIRRVTAKHHDVFQEIRSAGDSYNFALKTLVDVGKAKVDETDETLHTGHTDEMMVVYTTKADYSPDPLLAEMSLADLIKEGAIYQDLAFRVNEQEVERLVRLGLISQDTADKALNRVPSTPQNKIPYDYVNFKIPM